MSRARVAVTLLTLSAAGLVGILTREDIKTEAYPDPVHGWAVPTIGAGSTDGVKPDDTITPLAAVQRAHRELHKFEGRLKECMDGIELHQEEYDAYVRLAHNIGPTRFCFNEKGGPGVIVTRLRAGDHRGACDAILFYNRAGPVNRPEDRCSHPDNRTCRGLWRDRLETHALCVSAQ
jgi:lysozyme